MQNADGDALVDAYVTLCVHAGIASADVLCCARLGVHAQGDNHGEAIQLLEREDRRLARDLALLLGMKTRAGFSPMASTAPTKKSAGRSTARLLTAAESI